MVVGRIGDCSTRLLIDTGSAVYFVGEDVWREATELSVNLLTFPARPTVAANGEELEFLGQDKLQLQVGDLQVQFPFFITRELTQGTDFLKQHNCVINMREQTLVAAGKQVVYQPNQFPELMSVCHVSISADAVIPGHCQMHVPVSHSQQL